MSIQRPERIFTGTVASPGIVAGRLRLHARRRASHIAAGSPVEEALRLDRALSAAAARLDRRLRRDGNRLNPGTSADLIAASLFVWLLDTGPRLAGR